MEVHREEVNGAFGATHAELASSENGSSDNNGNVVPPNLRPQGSSMRARNDNSAIDVSDDDAEYDETFDETFDEEIPVIEEAEGLEPQGSEGSEPAASSEDDDGVPVESVAEEGKMAADDSGNETFASHPPTFAIARLKKLLHLGAPTVKILSADAVRRVADAVELIVQDLSREAITVAKRRGKKIVTYEHVAEVVRSVDRFAFLSEVIPPPAPRPTAASPFRRKQTQS